MPTPRRLLAPVLLLLTTLALTAAVGLTPAAQAPAQPAVAAPPQPQAGTAPKPRVRLFATGGTISNRTGNRLTADELLASMPTLDRWARGEAEQFSNVSSGELTLAQWLQLSRRINDAFGSDRELAGAVVTVGTDTLEELAYFLHVTVRDDRPVVVVGSMRNPSTLGYEGAANLLEGFRVAADPAARGQGTLVVLNDEINSAREVTKTDALRLHTFQSRGYGVVGVVDADRVAWYRAPVKRRGARSEFDVAQIKELPRVDVIMVYQGAPGDLIKAAVDNGARGIVMATAGAGAISGTQADGLDYAAQKGVFIVTTTRTGGGRIAPRAGTAGADGASGGERRRAFTIAGEDLLPVKARILLALALTRTSDRDELQRIFSEY